MPLFMRRPGSALDTLEHDLAAQLVAHYQAACPTPASVPPFAIPGDDTRSVGRKRYQLVAGIASAGVAVVGLSAAGYAAVGGGSFTDRLFTTFNDSGLGEGQPLGLRQTFGGITVTVDRVIYDGQSVEVEGPLRKDEPPGAAPRTTVPVLVQYTVSGLEGGPARYIIQGTLFTVDGRALPALTSVGLRGSSEILGREIPAGSAQELAAFDSSNLSSGEDGLALRLVVTVGSVTESPGDPPANDGRSAEASAAVPSPTVGPFVFEFTARQD